jgi:hypothetical protein
MDTKLRPNRQRPDVCLLPGTREEIPGLLPARTTGFRLADFADRGRAHVGDPIRFWLRGTGYDNTVLVKMEAW